MKKNKYNIRNNISKPKRKKHSLTFKGVEYRSGFELGIAKNLDKKKVKFKYESIKIVYFKKIRKAKCFACGNTNILEQHIYTPDFILPNGVIVEAKGKFTSRDRTKMKNVIESNPDLDIRMLFMYNNWVTKKKLQRYSDWCDKQNIKYAIMKIPKEWYDA